MTETNKGGRPRKIDSPDRFDELVDCYILDCLDREAPVTWTGMALYLGFTSRQAIDEYANYVGFSDCVKRAKLFVERAYEERLHGNSPTGAIFALKNMGWSDRSEHEITGKDGGPLESVTRVEIVAGDDSTD